MYSSLKNIFYLLKENNLRLQVYEAVGDRTDIINLCTTDGTNIGISFNIVDPDSSSKLSIEIFIDHYLKPTINLINEQRARIK